MGGLDMNTLAHISAIPAVLWLSVFAYSTLGNAARGTALLVVFMFLLPKTLLAAWEDLDNARGRNEE